MRTVEAGWRYDAACYNLFSSFFIFRFSFPGFYVKRNINVINLSWLEMMLLRLPALHRCPLPYGQSS